MSERVRLDDETRLLGSEQVRAIRGRLGAGRPPEGRSRPPAPQPDGAGDSAREAWPDVVDVNVGDAVEGLTDPAVMGALMAVAAERERLEERVRKLDAEVARLQGALGAVLKAAGTGLAPPEDGETEHSVTAHRRGSGAG